MKKIARIVACVCAVLIVLLLAAGYWAGYCRRIGADKFYVKQVEKTPDMLKASLEYINSAVAIKHYSYTIENRTLTITLRGGLVYSWDHPVLTDLSLPVGAELYDTVSIAGGQETKIICGEK